MRKDRRFIALRLSVALALSMTCLVAPAWADFQAGMEAYNRGDFKTALREWQPLAEQGKKSGVDGNKVRQALLGGFAASRVLEVHGERMLTGNYKPGFKARLYKKDLRIVAEALATQGVAAPGTAVVQQLVHAQLAAGGGEDDYSGLATVIFRLAGLA